MLNSLLRIILSDCIKTRAHTVMPLIPAAKLRILRSWPRSNLAGRSAGGRLVQRLIARQIVLIAFVATNHRKNAWIVGEKCHKTRIAPALEIVEKEMVMVLYRT